MMIELLPDVIFVEGAVNGAIYDLVRERVFAVNSSAASIIRKTILPDALTDGERDYLNVLERMGLFSSSAQPRAFSVNQVPECTQARTFDLVWLELTNACNLACVHCYEGDDHRRTSYRMTYAQWQSVIDQVAELGIKCVVVIGGEPSMHPDVCRVLRYLHMRKMPTSFFTNATFCNQELKDTIVDTQTQLRVSLYGHNGEVHDAITRVPGSFERTVENIKWFLGKKVPVHVSVIFMRENEGFRAETEAFLQKLGVDGYKLDVIRCVYGGSQVDHLPVTDEIRRLGRICEPRFRISRMKFYSALRFNPCWNRKLVVSEDGTILPCEFARGIRVGNIREQSLSEIVRSKPLASCWGLTMDKVSVCRKCEFRYACRDCRPYAMSKRNCPTDKTPKCDYDPERGEWNNERG